MDDNEETSAYPDPSSAYVTPYSLEPDSVGPYGDPRHGGLWQAGPAPCVSDDSVGRDEAFGVGATDDNDDDLRAMYARFNLDNVLAEGSSGMRQQEYLDAARDFDFGMDEDEDIAETEDAENGVTLAAHKERAELDPDLELSDELSDDDSDADSLNSELLDEIINEDFNGSNNVRGGGRGRGRPRGRGRGRGRGWKWALKGTEHDPASARGSRPRGRPKGSRGAPRGSRTKGRPAGSAQSVDPGQEFKELQAKATQQFLAGQYEEAAEFARQAVKLNPEVFAAHSLLSEVLEAQGRAKDSLAVLIAGAHTKRDPELWFHVSRKTLELAGEDPSPESLDAAAYCLSWAIRLNTQDYDARRERLNLILRVYQMTNSGHAAARARNECRYMLKLRPSDVLVAREHAELAVLSQNHSEIRKAKQLYDESLALHPESSTLGPDPDEDEQWNHALVYLGLIEHTEGNVDAIKHLKRLARWIQQRKDETFWDVYDDDREFDTEDESRKEQLVQYMDLQRADPANFHVSRGLPLDMRVKLGLYRLSLGTQYHEEALGHFAYLSRETDNIVEVTDLFRDVADALRSRDKPAEAIRFYEPLQDVPDCLDLVYYSHLAECHLKVGQDADAEECFKIIVENNASDVEARVALVKMYETQGRGQESLPLIADIIRMGRHDALRKNKISIPRKQIRAEERKRELEATLQVEAEDHELFLKGAMEAAQNSIVDQVIMDVGTEEQLRLREEMNLFGRATKKHASATRKPYLSGLSQSMGSSRPNGHRVPMLRAERMGTSNAALERQQKIADRLRVMKSANERIHAHHETVKSCEADMRCGDEDAAAIWKSAASGMLDEFKACKYHYNHMKEKQAGFQGYGRQAKWLSNLDTRDQTNDGQSMSIDDVFPDKFHDISHSTWLDLFCKLALQHAREGDPTSCHAILDDANRVNVFIHDRDFYHQLWATSLACALHLNDEARLSEILRQLMTDHAFSPTAYHMFASAFRLHVGPSTWFNAAPTQKFLLRSVKQFDFHNLPDSQRSAWPVTASEKASMTASGRKFPGWPGLSDLSPNLLALYGHVMAAAQTWIGALNYYFRALAMRPKDPTLLLCIGSAYVMNAMKRQSENRHWMIMQGLGFLGEYKSVRRRMTEETGTTLYLQEAEFNIARAWHFLGLNHLAIKGYRECLRLSKLIRREKERKTEVSGQEMMLDVEEYTQEAALGLINIYVTTEQPTRAREVAEEYLVV